MKRGAIFFWATAALFWGSLLITYNWRVFLDAKKHNKKTQFFVDPKKIFVQNVGVRWKGIHA